MPPNAPRKAHHAKDVMRFAGGARWTTRVMEVIKLSDEFMEIPQTSAAARREGETHRRSLFSRLLALAKEAIFFVYLYSGYVQLRDLILSLLGRSRAVVVYYHRVGDCDVLTKPTEDFRRDLEYFKSNYECISLAEMCERVLEDARFRRRSVVVTFDDGYRDNFTEAVPALRRAGVTATFFVSTGFIETEKEFPHDLESLPARAKYGEREQAYYAKLTWDDLRAMQAAGFEIGSHTVNHANLGRADRQTIQREVNDSLAALNRELGAQPRAFSFPWGKPCDFSDQAIKAVQEAGYYSCATAYGGSNTRGSKLFNIRRLDVGNGQMSELAMRARVAGFDPDYFRLKLKNRNL